MIFFTMNGEVRLRKITDHQKVKYVRNFEEHARESLGTGELNKSEFKIFLNL